MEKIKIHPALTCFIDESIVNIAKKLKKEKHRRIFVIDDEKKLKGVITTTDLVYKALAENKTALKARDIMTKKVEYVEQSDELEKALGVMNSTKSYVCPITENGKFIGLLSHHDIVGFLISSSKK